VDFRAVDLSLHDYHQINHSSRRAGTSRMHDPRERQFRLPRIPAAFITRWLATIGRGVGAARSLGDGAIDSSIQVGLRPSSDH
jgi:hypothetical protein